MISHQLSIISLLQCGEFRAEQARRLDRGAAGGPRRHQRDRLRPAQRNHRIRECGRCFNFYGNLVIWSQISISAQAVKAFCVTVGQSLTTFLSVTGMLSRIRETGTTDLFAGHSALVRLPAHLSSEWPLLIQVSIYVTCLCASAFKSHAAV